MSYEPELGQAIFSNSPWGEFETSGYVTAGIEVLGAAISKGVWEDDPTNNVGGEFVNDTFALRAYCWCDGEGDHADGCPPNFQCGNFEARWYKHSRRGASQNQEISPAEWQKVLLSCLLSLGG